jgi:hypothetical protein
VDAKEASEERVAVRSMTSAPWDYESPSDGGNQIEPQSQATGNSPHVKSPVGPALIVSQEAILDTLKTELSVKYD